MFVYVAMASKKRKLTSARVQELLEQSSDSNVSDSGFDDTDNEVQETAIQQVAPIIAIQGVANDYSGVSYRVRRRPL